jgi:Myb-like DNA-binding domain
MPEKNFEEDVDIDEDVLMVNHRGSVSPLSTIHDPEPMQVEHPQVNGDVERPTTADSNAMQIDIADNGPGEHLPTPSPSQCEVDDLPAVFDLPSDVIYASVNELPKKDGSSLAQLPMYGPPVVTDEPYHNEIDALPIVPISKFCLERYVLPVKSWTPPNRHYRQDTPEDEDDTPSISKEVQVEPIPNFAPAGQDAQPSRRRTSAIIIRPPAPPLHLTDQRPSPWTDEEIHLLLQYAKENAYNFDLVASAMSFSSSSISVTEKRSAWECFEKFREISPDVGVIQLTGQNRAAAMNALERRAKRLAGGAGRQKSGEKTLNRGPRMDIRNHRYLTMFDMMKRSAKNREKAKAQGTRPRSRETEVDVAEKPAPKKQKDNLPTKPAMNTPTPLELARLKAERDRQLQQSILQQRQEQVPPLS